jgi:DNA-binding response OmpR family regulator
MANTKAIIIIFVNILFISFTSLIHYKINVVLLDQQLPEQSGLELARQIKEGKIGDNKDLPVIMVTIDTKENTVMEAKEIGIHEYLVKPISPLALKKRLCTAFGIKEKA